MKIIATIEARLNSTRLPRKHLLKCGKKFIIEHLIERVKKITGISGIILATTTNKLDDQLINIAIKNKIKYFRGSENNVLKRICDIGKKYSADAIVEISGDCPLIDFQIISQQVRTFKINKPDLLIDSWNTLPQGLTAPVVNVKSLFKSQRLAKSTDDQEHVLNCILNKPNKFNIMYFEPLEKNIAPKLEFLLDEYKDYLFIKKILKYDKKNEYLCQDLINLIDKKKDILKINKNIKRISNTFHKKWIKKLKANA
jgi:spore coat polysaccharide biosynthesis protein SpsF